MKIENRKDLDVVINSLINAVDDVFGYANPQRQWELVQIQGVLETIHKILKEDFIFEESDNVLR